MTDLVGYVDAATQAEQELPDDDDGYRAPIEFRAATLVDVKPRQRLVTVLAVPYDREALVTDSTGRPVRETVRRGAFGGVVRRTRRVPVNRDHDRTRLVGAVKALHPNGDDGLLADLKLAATPAGDEALTLCDEDMLSPSVGFAPMLGGETYDRMRSHREITRAYLDHIALVPDPAYEEAKVLEVRQQSGLAVVTSATPILDRLLAERLAVSAKL